MILKMSAAGGWGIAPFSAAQRRFWQPKAAGIRENTTAVVIAKWEGKVGNLVLGFHFSGPLRRGCGNVEISPPLGEIPKGLVERGGSLLLAFHAFHSPVISIAPFPGRRSQRKRGGNGDAILQDRSSLLLAAPIFRAHSVSLMLLANWSNWAKPKPGFKYCFASGSDFSFSFGVA